LSSPTETLTFSNFPEDRFKRLEATKEAEGLKLTGEDGEVKDHGADVEFHHTGTTLTLIVKHGPHLVNFDKFVAKLTSWVKAQV
jgi:hypothetical protein